MTVPFRPSVLPTPEPQFLDTVTRSFLQTRNLVEADRESGRAAQLFEQDIQQGNLRSEQLAQNLEIQREDRRIEQALDPRIQSREQVTEPTRAGRVTQRLGLEDTGRAGSLASAVSGAAAAPQERIRPGVQQVGEDVFVDPGAEQRTLSTASGQLAESLTKAAGAEPDPAMGEALRAAIPSIVGRVELGQNPQIVVQEALGIIRENQFLKNQLGEEAVSRLEEAGLSMLPLEQQRAELRQAGTDAAGAARDIREHEQQIELKGIPTAAQTAAGERPERGLRQDPRVSRLQSRIIQLTRDLSQEEIPLTDPDLGTMIQSGEARAEGGKFFRTNVDQAEVRQRAQRQALEEFGVQFTEDERAEIAGFIDEISGPGTAQTTTRVSPQERTTQLLGEGKGADEIKRILREEGYTIR